MTSVPTLPTTAEVTDRARELATRIHPGPKSAKRSLPIRASVEEVTALWEANRVALLDGIPATSSALASGADQGPWGMTFTVALELNAPVPGVATQALAGKVVRRLKALAETGEIPTTEHTPAYREGTT